MSEAGSIRQVSPSDAIEWLRLGWRDFYRLPLIAAIHGLVLIVGALTIVSLGYYNAGLLAGAFSGFVLVAPTLMIGLYALSRSLAAGEPCGLSTVVDAWRSGGTRAVRFGLLLALVGSVWVLVSSMILTLAEAQDGGVRGYLVFFAGESSPFLFWLWLLTGGAVAALVFAGSAIALPMLVDQHVGVRSAVKTSLAAVGQNPVTMVIWAGIIMTLTLLAIVTLIGLLVLLPVLGHASWHAYRALVVPD